MLIEAHPSFPCSWGPWIVQLSSTAREHKQPEAQELCLCCFHRNRAETPKGMKMPFPWYKTSKPLECLHSWPFCFSPRMAFYWELAWDNPLLQCLQTPSKVCVQAVWSCHSLWSLCLPLLPAGTDLVSPKAGLDGQGAPSPSYWRQTLKILSILNIIAHYMSLLIHWVCVTNWNESHASVQEWVQPVLSSHASSACQWNVL